MPNFEHLKLYHARWSLCSEMVRVAMEEKGLSYESKEIKLIDQYPDGENISPEYLLINPNKWGRGITHIWIASHASSLKPDHEVELFDCTFYHIKIDSLNFHLYSSYLYLYILDY